MTAVRRVVCDTNLLVALYVFDDPHLAPLHGAIDNGAWHVLTRADCLEEFRRVLGYPHFKLDAEGQASALAAYVQIAQFNDAPAQNDYPLPRCRDRDDQKFLELARDAGADWLLTADKDLLRLMRRDKLAGRFTILTPAQALTLI
jgi:putative PIN family toxin of toxin-antitoxin system